MKQIVLFLAVSTSLLLSSCYYNNDDDGTVVVDPVIGQVFETTVDFNISNQFSALIPIPNNIEVFESDVIAVYLLEDVVPNQQGGAIDVWSQLPQTFFPPQGTLVYNFDHTFLDVRLFLGANFDLNTLGSQFTQNQTFRIAVLPAEFADANLSMDQLLTTFEINLNEIEKIE